MRFTFLRNLSAALSLSVIGMTVACGAGQAGTIQVSGTGISLGIAERLGSQLSARSPEHVVVVLPSMGSGGGLKALRDEVIDVSFSARRLKPKEEAWGLRESGCMRTPLAFATNHHTPNGFEIGDLPAIYGSLAPYWNDGTQLKIILRSRSGSELPYLAAQVPGLGEAFETAFKRPDIAIGTSDQVNAELADTISGSLAIMTLLQIRSEKLDLATIPIDGVSPSPETVTDGSYPFSLRVCLILPKQPKAAALALAEQFASLEGEKMIAEMGAALSE
ncbi:substrate-binding domain-containing protein [Nisaea acidiphila]|uniref:Substrate-binding domain-containing protein n=1 Tax=Nisaea acidiphila TaxID=1862145 RepID=A0A9J7AVA4_9PROT|nr:substrate-binding domain-containing protein [Nisaea acidiphila]UUX50393.1 substrate-binding domain-containing protein [Nisaea acidiphila]